MSKSKRNKYSSQKRSAHVVDELASLRSLSLGENDLRAYAQAHVSLAPIARMVERAHQHDKLQDRILVKIIRKESSEAAWAHFASILLIYANRLAIALVPARGLEDVAIKVMLAASAVDKLGASRADARREAVSQRAFDVSDAPGALIHGLGTGARFFAPDTVDADRPSQLAPGVTATIHRGGETAMLASFALATPNIRELLLFAERELRLADTWRESASDESRRETEAIHAADHARLRAYSALASIALWPVKSERDIAAKDGAVSLVEGRPQDPPKLRASVELALIYGEHLSTIDALLGE